MTTKAQKIFNMVLAVLVSIGAWVFVVYNYDPMTETTYSDVRVECTGEEALAQRGLAVSEVESEGISVTLNQKRIDSGRISSDDISIKADVSSCVAGDNTVPLSVSSPSDTTVISADEDAINISVGRSKSSTMSIDVIYSEGAEDNTEPIAFDMSRTEAEVICTSDVLKNIERVAAVLDHDEVGSDVKSYTVKLKALDKDGNELQHVVIAPNEISLDACAGFTKSVSLTIPVRNPDSENYIRKYTAPEAVTVKGAQEDIDKLGSVRAYEIDLSGIYENDEIPVEYNLPEGIYIADESEGQMLSVMVTKKESSDDEDDS